MEDLEPIRDLRQRAGRRGICLRGGHVLTIASKQARQPRIRLSWLLRARESHVSLVPGDRGAFITQLLVRTREKEDAVARRDRRRPRLAPEDVSDLRPPAPFRGSARGKQRDRLANGAFETQVRPKRLPGGVWPARIQLP